jgi:large subunit ribosomal protein L3
MISTFFGTKIKTSSTFDDKGRYCVVTHLRVKPLTVTQIKSHGKDGYWAVQVAVGEKSNKSLKKPQKVHLKRAKLKSAPRFLRELKVSKEPTVKVGDKIQLTEVFSLNDQVKITGTTKGKGFAGVIKRWGFHGGPRTHGQSDRPRSPGSIGQGTDPGRVWKGKKMPGHYGASTKSIRGLQIISINSDAHELQISGTVPGHYKSLLKITKTGTGSATSGFSQPRDRGASSEPSV